MKSTKIDKKPTESTKARLKLIILDLIQGPINEKTDYSIVIEYTALPERFGCKVCADFHADFGYTAKASKGNFIIKPILIHFGTLIHFEKSTSKREFCDKVRMRLLN